MATDRPALAMRSRDGVIVEVFEYGKEQARLLTRALKLHRCGPDTTLPPSMCHFMIFPKPRRCSRSSNLLI